jgi:alkanesulfonate monooxygenase SsuD/methylene tetrahydromethanopterin reductase-like flavin-dependent oxidoreductase (luciferase family)
MWPKWQERWDRVVEAIAIIRRLWTGQRVTHKGAYTVDAAADSGQWEEVIRSKAPNPRFAAGGRAGS